MMPIEDFGQKIGGAKKDLWRERGFMITEDMLSMNAAERQKYIKKDLVWKKPDYQELVDSGIPLRVVYFMKLVRDGLPAKPALTYLDKEEEDILAKQEGYIQFVGEIRDKVMSLRDENEILTFYNEFFKENYLDKQKRGYYVYPLPNTFGCVTNKLLKAVQQSKFTAIDRDIKKLQFCYSEEQKLKALETGFLNRFDVYVFDRENVEFSKDYRDRTVISITTDYGRNYVYPKELENTNPEAFVEGKVFIVKDYDIFDKNIDSIEEANEIIKDLFKESYNKMQENQPKVKQNEKARKKAFIPQQLVNIQRVGEDYRHNRNVTGDDYLKVFHFLGGEYGNWMNEIDRQGSLNFGYDALLDMCKAINIHPSDISLGNRLSIAFGARGSGSALAHYEPMREVINLTKMKGAGSLAHEWGHALDNIMASHIGLKDWMTDAPGFRNSLLSLKPLVDALKYKKVSTSEVLESQKQKVESLNASIQRFIHNLFPLNKMTDEQKDKLDSLIDKFIKKAPECTESFYTYVISGEGNRELDELSAFRKEITNRSIDKNSRIDLAHYQNNLRMALDKVGEPALVETDFYKDSRKFDTGFSKSDKGYWASTKEMFARAFACYVFDKVKEKGGKSDYLCGHANSAVTMVENKNTGKLEKICAYPVGAERTAINKCFDELILELQEKELLHVYEPPIEERKPSLADTLKGIEASKIKIHEEEKGKHKGQFAFDFDELF